MFAECAKGVDAAGTSMGTATAGAKDSRLDDVHNPIGKTSKPSELGCTTQSGSRNRRR